jgi:hypothetical protein
MDLLGKLLLQSIGPLVSAVVGTLIIGGLLSYITRKAQERRADSQLKEERIRAENKLRVELIGQMTEAASSLYIATQDFWRKKNKEKVPDENLVQHREELDQRYRATRVMGEVLERRLEAYFLSSEPKTLWHATMDLLTVRYFHLIGLETEELLKENAKNVEEEHSSLSITELRDQKLILKTYREKLPKAARAVLQSPMMPLVG